MPSITDRVLDALESGNFIIRDWQDDANPNLGELTGLKNRRVAIIDLGPSEPQPEVPDDPGATLNRNG